MEYNFYGSFSIIDFYRFFNENRAGRDEKTFAGKFLFFNDASWHWNDGRYVQFCFCNYMVFDQHPFCKAKYKDRLFCLFHGFNCYDWFNNRHPDWKIWPGMVFVIPVGFQKWYLVI